MRIAPIAALGIVMPLLANDPKTVVQTTSTERANFAAGGLIRLSDSHGDLYVEGWDKPEVEIVVTKSGRDAAAQQTRVAIERVSDTELNVSTTKKRGVAIEYRIHVPRDSRLAIRHGGGNILVSNVNGGIVAANRNGDILLMLPEGGQYDIDARSKIGTVTSDFVGTAHVRRLVGERFAATNPTATHRIYLRMGFGGITIKATRLM